MRLGGSNLLFSLIDFGGGVRRSEGDWGLEMERRGRGEGEGTFGVAACDYDLDN